MISHVTIFLYLEALNDHSCYYSSTLKHSMISHVTILLYLEALNDQSCYYIALP
jgi:hypothetical protein